MRTKEVTRTAPKKSAPFPLPRALLLELGLRFGLGALASQGLLLGRRTPFALGWVAASGPGLGGAAALCGSLVGFLLGMTASEALRYSAAAVLIFAAAFACLDQKLSRNPWFMPLCAAAATGVTGVLALSGSAWSRTAVLGTLSEVLLAALSCLLFRGINLRERPAPESLLFLASVLTVCLCRAHITAGGTLAALVTLTAARAGAGAGALAGGCTGLAAGLTAQGTPLLGTALTFAGGLTGGFSRRQGRLGAVLIFAGGGLLAAAWVSAGVPSAQSIALGAAIFSAVPERLLRRCDGLLLPARRAAGAAERAPSSADRVRFRLEEQAAAFQRLYEHIHESVLRGETPENSGVIFDRVSERVCRGCSLDPICWRRDHTATCQALTQALEAMQERGSGEAEDYPLAFRSHCMNLDKFVSCANEELHSYWYRQQYRRRMKRNRLAVCRQYVQLSSLLSSAARELDEEREHDPSGAAAAERALARLGIEASCDLCVDSRGRRTLEVRGSGLAAAAGSQGNAALSQALGVRMEPSDVCRVRRGQRLCFRQTPPLAATVAVAAKEKQSGQQSGDNGIWFRDGEGILWVVLCDGMGSGGEAARDSRLLLTLLKDFLHAGVEPVAALSAITGALGLRGELDGGFTTVDLLRIDLFSGAAELYKLGGAPTYLRRGGQVSRLTGSALPAGLELDQESVPDMTRFRLGAGDLVLLLTDGVTDGQGDGWLRSALSAYRGESPRELAQAVLASPAAGREDDRTVVAIRVSERS